MAKFIKAVGTVEWAKIFPSNMDKGGDDNNAAKSVKAKGGQYIMDFYPEDPDGFQQELVSNGVDMAPMGHKRIKVRDGKEFYKLKRVHNGPVDKKTNKPIPELSGAPKVVDSDKRPWDVDEQGEIGNGSKVGVVLEVYGSNIRLAAVQVLELVEYDTPDLEDMLDF